MPASAGIWKWSDRLGNAPKDEFRLTLGEGCTPLVRSRRIGPDTGLTNLYFKLESANPTGSYKDRFAASAVSHLLARKKTQCLATSSGNTGAALAAACAVAGIPCHLAIVEPAPDGKLSQMLAYGAKLYRIRGFGIDPGCGFAQGFEGGVAKLPEVACGLFAGAEVLIGEQGDEGGGLLPGIRRCFDNPGLLDGAGGGFR